MIYLLSIFECLTHYSSLFLKEIKLIDIANLIFHASDFFESIPVSLNYGLFSLKYFPTDTALLLSP